MSTKSKTSVLLMYKELRRKVALLSGQAAKNIEFGPNQIGVLYRLSISGATIGQLVDYTLADKASVSRTINSLVKSGYVVKKISPQDKRVVNIELTMKGKQKALKAIEIRKEMGMRLDSCLTKSEREQFKILINKIIENA